jgi:hypothetical protein
MMTQICVALLALILLQGKEYAWGVPALVLAIVGLAGLFHPASLRALRRPAPPVEAAPKKVPPKKAEPARKAPAGSKAKR